MSKDIKLCSDQELMNYKSSCLAMLNKAASRSTDDIENTSLYKLNEAIDKEIASRNGGNK